MPRDTEDHPPPSTNQQTLWSRLTHGAPLAVLLAAVLYVLYQLLPVLELVVVATLLAVILRTVLRWLQKFVKQRWIAVLVLVGLMAGFSLFLVAVILPNILDETQQLLATLPAYLNSLINLSIELRQKYSFIPDLSQGLSQVRNTAYQILLSFPLLITQAFGSAIEIVAMLILALYMAYDPNTLIAGSLRLVPRRQHQRFKRILKATQTRLRGWIFGTGIAMLFLGAGATIGLWALGIPLALTFGIIAGLLEVIPYFGSVVGTFLPALVALTLSPLKFLLVLLLFLILNQLDAHLIQPLVMGRQVHLHPVVIILAFLVLGKLLGFLGILLAVPIAAIVVTLFDDFNPQ